MKNTTILTEKNFNKLKYIFKKEKEKGNELIFSSEEDDLNRKVIEKLNVFGLMISLKERKDFSKQRNSGFNEVLARIMKKKNIVLVFDLDEFFSSKLKERILARWIQNIEICKKSKLNIKFYSLEKMDEKDLKSLSLSLGMPTWMLMV